MKIMMGIAFGFVLGYLTGVFTPLGRAMDQPVTDYTPIENRIQPSTEQVLAAAGEDPDGKIRTIRVDREGRVIVSPDSEQESSVEVYPLKKSRGPDMREWRQQWKTERVWALETPGASQRFPETCVQSHGNSDLTSNTVVEYPCRSYQTDLAGNRKPHE